MVPSAFLPVEAFPLTPSGKVDRRALPEPGSTRPELATPYLAPQSWTQEELCKVWAEVIGINTVGIHDNFFDLGGHSLAATRLISRVIQTFHLELPLKALFDSPTVAEMAEIIVQNQSKKASDEELARMLNEVETLSEEEAQKLPGDRARIS